ncbi:hypothetical protein GOODEAATRI_003019 [Goodea atripinnis]|uniref:Uncharacterized protein n=1 Tax=Goodea atripinnis TaxID=208336 RepID=A0ABV0MEZ8_9TELE
MITIPSVQVSKHEQECVSYQLFSYSAQRYAEVGPVSGSISYGSCLTGRFDPLFGLHVFHTYETELAGATLGCHMGSPPGVDGPARLQVMKTDTSTINMHASWEKVGDLRPKMRFDNYSTSGLKLNVK